LTRTPAVPGCDGRRASVLLNSIAVDAILSLSDMAQHRPAAAPPRAQMRGPLLT
jgi:hypothetical protein